MNQTRVVISNVNPDNSSAKMGTASIQFKSVMELINVVIIQKKEKIARDLLASISISSVRHLQIKQHSVLKMSNVAMAFR